MGQNLDIITIITTATQVVTLVVVIVYTIYTAKMTSATRASAEAADRTVKEMKETRIQENSPYIVVYLDVLENKHVIYLVVRNIGKSTAEDVEFKFTPPLTSAVFREIANVTLVKDGIRSLPPGYEIKTFFDGAIQRFGNKDLPLIYDVEISYKDGLTNSQKVSMQKLDLSVFYGLMSIDEKDMDDLVKVVEDIGKNIKSINDNLKEISNNLERGIWIRNPLFLLANVDFDPSSWSDVIRAKLEEFSILWHSTSDRNAEKMINPFLSDLKSKISLVSSQIVLLLSMSPPDVPDKLIKLICSIASDFAKLARKRFYIDGGKSIEEFYMDGDKIIEDIKRAIDQINDYKKLLSASSEEFFD